jgi:hypothetical protein
MAPRRPSSTDESRSAFAICCWAPRHQALTTIVVQMWGLNALGGGLTPVAHGCGRPGSCCLPRISSSIFWGSYIFASSNCHVCRIVLLLFAHLHLISLCYPCKILHSGCVAQDLAKVGTLRRTTFPHQRSGHIIRVFRSTGTTDATTGDRWPPIPLFRAI